MTTQPLAPFMQRLAAPALPGTWQLPARRAISLCPREDGKLRVAHGRLWATFDGPHQGALNNLGDLVVGSGQQLWVRAGQRVVVEAWDGGAPAYFSWEPLPAPAREAVPRFVAVTQPLADLRLALAFGAGAAGRLAAGLWHLATGRGHGAPARRPALPANAACC